jgi:hypothetical protein
VLLVTARRWVLAGNIVLDNRHAGILAANKMLKQAGPDEETPWQDM